jgi:hypothetical protein
MPTKAYGRMVFWEGASLWVLGTRPGEGPYPKTEFHAHHAVQVTLSLRDGSPSRLEIGRSGVTRPPSLPTQSTRSQAKERWPTCT